MTTSTSTIDISFPQGLQVKAKVGEYEIPTDQPVKDGGQGLYPSPFGLFLSAIATCAGYYALRFCEKHELDTTGLTLKARCDFQEKPFRLEKMTLQLTLPKNFPTKYEKPLLRTVNHCTVKMNILTPPEFETVLVNT